MDVRGEICLTLNTDSQCATSKFTRRSG